MKIEERHSYIGGTDCAAILGVSRWKSLLQVWAEKTGAVEPEDISDREQVRFGIFAEDYVATRFMEKTGKKVRRVNETLYHPTHKFIAANIDRRIVGEDAILECKTTSAFKERDWNGGEIPEEYIAQCCHYLAVTGAQKAYIAVLIGNHRFVWQEIDRNEKLISEIIKKEVAFWNNFVAPKIQPEIISCSDSELLCKLFSPVSDCAEEMLITDDETRILESIESISSDIRSLEGQKEQLENVLKSKMGDKQFAKNDLWRITWKEQITNRIDTKQLKEKMPDVYKQFAKEIKTRTFRAKRIQQQEA